MDASAPFWYESNSTYPSTFSPSRASQGSVTYEIKGFPLVLLPGLGVAVGKMCINHNTFNGLVSSDMEHSVRPIVNAGCFPVEVYRYRNLTINIVATRTLLAPFRTL